MKVFENSPHRISGYLISEDVGPVTLTRDVSRDEARVQLFELGLSWEGADEVLDDVKTGCTFSFEVAE